MFVFPFSQDNLTVRRLPWVTIVILLTCVGVHFWSVKQNEKLSPAMKVWESEMDAFVQRAAAMCAKMGRKCDTSAFLRARTLDDLIFASDQVGLATEAQSYKERLEEIMRDRATNKLGLRPALDKLSSWPGFKRLFTHMFAHADWGHLFGNMFMLYLLGTSIEDRWGRWRYLLFYVVGGLVAVMTFRVLHLRDSVPLVGASGAIAAAMGAFSILFWRSRIKWIYVVPAGMRSIGTFHTPAWLTLILWFGQQALEARREVDAGAVVAYSAHAAGFLFGAVVSIIALKTGYDRRINELVDVAAGGWKEDDDYLAAQAAVDNKNDAKAVSLLEAVLKRHPQHLGAHVLMYDIALRRKNVPVALQHAEVAFVEWQKSEPTEVIARYPALDALVDADGRHRLPTGRTLGAVLSASKQQKHLATADLVLSRVAALPEHPLLGRAYFVCGEIAEVVSGPVVAQAYFSELVERCPQDAFAVQARQKLEKWALA